MSTPLISATEAIALSKDPGVRFCDATVFMPGDPRDGATTYLEAHVPGAVFFDASAIADRETDLPHMLPSAGGFARAVGALGIGNETHVVLYDRFKMMGAARAWWMFGVFGHDLVSVIDGGFDAWVAAGGEVRDGAVTVEPRTFVPSLRTSLLRGIGDMRALPEGTAVLDARSADRFYGRVPEPRAELAGGHIPGSVNLPFTELLDADGRLLEPGALREKFAERGAADAPMVATCGSGVSGSVLLLARAAAGLPAGALYDGSWSEWGGRADTPKETT